MALAIHSSRYVVRARRGSLILCPRTTIYHLAETFQCCSPKIGGHCFISANNRSSRLARVTGGQRFPFLNVNVPRTLVSSIAHPTFHLLIFIIAALQKHYIRHRIHLSLSGASDNPLRPKSCHSVTLHRPESPPSTASSSESLIPSSLSAAHTCPSSTPTPSCPLLSHSPRSMLNQRRLPLCFSHKLAVPSS